MMRERPEKPNHKGQGQSVTDQRAADHGPEIDAELQAHIGRHLKASYDDILGQDVPDRFVDLLKQLEEKETQPAGTKGAR
jgi:hypothetical protein